MSFQLNIEGARLEHKLHEVRMSRELTASEIETGRLKAEWRPPMPPGLRSLRLPRVARRVPLVRRLA